MPWKKFYIKGLPLVSSKIELEEVQMRTGKHVLHNSCTEERKEEKNILLPDDVLYPHPVCEEKVQRRLLR
jgi:hypothetical protein